MHTGFDFRSTALNFSAVRWADGPPVRRIRPRQQKLPPVLFLVAVQPSGRSPGRATERFTVCFGERRCACKYIRRTLHAAAWLERFEWDLGGFGGALRYVGWLWRWSLTMRKFAGLANRRTRAMLLRSESACALCIDSLALNEIFQAFSGAACALGAPLALELRPGMCTLQMLSWEQHCKAGAAVRRARGCARNGKQSHTRGDHEPYSHTALEPAGAAPAPGDHCDGARVEPVWREQPRMRGDRAGIMS